MKTKIAGQVRQGDVLVLDVDKIEDAVEIPRDAGRVVLAYGEVTGHAHAIVADDVRHYRAKGTTLKTYLRLVTPVALRHEEHGEIPVKGKTKEVRIQRQWTSDRIRQVQD